MDSNMYSTRRSERLVALTAAIDAFLAQDVDGLSDVALTEEALELQPQLDRLHGGWLQRLAAVDARGAAGAEQDRQFGSTAGWLRVRLRMAATTASITVRTARALFRGPLPASGAALMAGEISAAHAEALATSTLHVPDQAIQAAEPTLLDSARARTRPGCARWSPTSSTPSTRTALMLSPNDGTNGGDVVHHHH